MVPRLVSRAEVAADATVHAAGLGFVAVAVPALLQRAWETGNTSAMTAIAVYAATLATMILASALYNLTWAAPGAPAWLVEALRRFDHGAIFLKIAGTYTPFAALSMASGPGPKLLAAVWAVAGIGAVVKAVAPRRFEAVSVPLYLALGWAVVFVGKTALSVISPEALWLLGGGGVLYTFGVAFHLWDRLRFQNAIWHLHVLAASICMYAAVMIETLR